jgi:hypothetical protein
MSVRTPKDDESKPTKKPMLKSGKVTNGKRQSGSLSLKTLFVANVEIRLKFPIMKIWKCTANPNISIYLTQDPTITFVTTENIKDCTSAPSAENFVQSQKVKDAIGVLRRATLSAFREADNEGTKPRTNATGKTTGNIIPKKKSISKPGNG